MQFFYLSPLGRILNRFSSDTYTVDDELPFDLNILLMQFVGLAGKSNRTDSVFPLLTYYLKSCFSGVLVTTIYGIPWLCLFIAPLMPVYHWLQNQYRFTSRELKRISSITRSLLYSQISETLSGLTIIRAFNDARRYINLY